MTTVVMGRNVLRLNGNMHQTMGLKHEGCGICIGFQILEE